MAWEWQAKNTAFTSTASTNTFGGLKLGFPSQYFDSESGLWYNMARYYDPTMGRFIQSDPIGLLGGINPYTYASSNAVSFVDPTGLICVPVSQLTINIIANGIGGAIVAGVAGAVGGGVGAYVNSSIQSQSNYASGSFVANTVAGVAEGVVSGLPGGGEALGANIMSNGSGGMANGLLNVPAPFNILSNEAIGSAFGAFANFVVTQTATSVATGGLGGLPGSTISTGISDFFQPSGSCGCGQ